MSLEEQKVDSDRYSIVPRVLIFSLREGKILLIKGAKNKKIWANLYNGIGGHVEQGENVLEAAKREFFEETGLELLTPQLCVIVTIDTNQTTGIGLFVFKGIAGSGIPIQSPEGSLEWLDLGDLSDLPLVEDLELLIPKVLGKTSTDSILFAQYNYDEKGTLRITFSE